MLYFFITIIILYIFFRLLGRYILPWIFKKYLKNVEKRFYEQNPHDKRGKNSKDSKIRIDYSEQAENQNKYDDVGEYVDFEEKKD